MTETIVRFTQLLMILGLLAILGAVAIVWLARNLER